MTLPNLAFIDTARPLEVEAVEGGRALSEFSLDPEADVNDEEARVLGRAVDDIAEIGERVRALQEYLDHARRAFRQRGLIYPFNISAGGDSLDVLPGQDSLARSAAALSEIVSQGHPASKDFEKRAFRSLQALVGGWGACVGAPRDDGHGPETGIRKFRGMLEPWEIGAEWPTFASAGDHGADGFILLGRSWGGPVLFFQSKNTGFDLRGFPEEFARMPEIFRDWFGKPTNTFRRIVPVCALNTVLTVDAKERIAAARGESATHIIDAVDILCTEAGDKDYPLRQSACNVL